MIDALYGFAVVALVLLAIDMVSIAIVKNRKDEREGKYGRRQG